MTLFRIEIVLLRLLTSLDISTLCLLFVTGKFIGDQCRDLINPGEDWMYPCSDKLGPGAVCDPNTHKCSCGSGWLSNMDGTKCIESKSSFVFTTHFFCLKYECDDLRRRIDSTFTH